MIRFLLLTILFVLASQVWAHPSAVCLHRLSQSATQLKACQIAQAQEGQCDHLQQALYSGREQCAAEGFVESDINSAVQYGFAQLEGDTSQSPYARQVQQHRWENSLMKPNVQRFQKQFPEYGHHLADITSNFNTAQCPKQYEGHREGWLFVGSQSIKRYPLGEQGGTSAQTYTVFLMAPQKQGQCYSPNPSQQTGQSYSVVNIPELMLLEMEKKPDTRLLRCQHPLCMDDKVALESIYEQYQRQYREYRQLMVCADIDIRNENRRSFKGQKRSKILLPDYCPQEEVQVKALNAKGNLDQLVQLLFQDVNIGVQTVKMEKK